MFVFVFKKAQTHEIFGLAGLYVEYCLSLIGHHPIIHSMYLKASGMVLSVIKQIVGIYFGGLCVLCGYVVVCFVYGWCIV